MKKYAITAIRNSAIKLKTTPILAIWAIVILPEEKTMALGGVPTGSMNAQLAAKVTGIHNCNMLY